jgi:hypothetical protein
MLVMASETTLDGSKAPVSASNNAFSAIPELGVALGLLFTFSRARAAVCWTNGAMQAHELCYTV